MTRATEDEPAREDGTVRLDELRAWLESKDSRGVKQVRIRTVLERMPGPGGDALMGSREVAETLGVPRPNVARLRRVGVLTEPFCELASGPIWLASQVDAARAEVERRRKVPAEERAAEREARRRTRRERRSAA